MLHALAGAARALPLSQAPCASARASQLLRCRSVRERARSRLLNARLTLRCLCLLACAHTGRHPAPHKRRRQRRRAALAAAVAAA